MVNDLHIEISSEAKSDTKLEVHQRGHESVVDESPALGGEDAGPNPLEYVFTGLAGCLNVTIHHVAAEKNIDVESLEINMTGDIDLEKFMNGSGARAGFEEIQVDIEMKTDADTKTEKQLLEEVEERCPISDNLQHETQVSIQG